MKLYLNSEYLIIKYITIFLMVFLVTVSCKGLDNNGLPPSDVDNGGLFLPDGFEALVVADSTGRARHIAVNDNGDIYVKLRYHGDRSGGGNLALRDTTNDGKVDIMQNFGDYVDEGHLAAGMRIHDGYLYFSSVRNVYRNKLTPGDLIPQSEMELILTDDHDHGVDHWHITKAMAFDGNGNIYVPFGSPSNSCQEMLIPSLASTTGAPGLDPCPELEDHGGIWRFDLNKTEQTQEDGELFATGIRNAVAVDWNPVDDNLYAVVHDRDNLQVLFPELFSPWQNAWIVAGEFIRVTEGSNFGWPYCFYNKMQEKKVLNPEYGGDGNIVGRCSEFEDPIVAFPRFAPNDLLFYQGDQFPDRYKNGAFIAFHGSNNRTPYPQAGFFVAFVPFENGEPSGDWEIFADGFTGMEPVSSPGDAEYRPMGLAEGPDGTLYLSESQKGKIWRIMFKGDKNQFGESNLDNMEKRKMETHIRTPDPIEDNLDKGLKFGPGELVFNKYCRSCHGTDGKGDDNFFPPLNKSEWVIGGDKERLISTILNGLEGPIDVKGRTYDGVMPSFRYLSDEEIADLLTFIRQNFGNNASEIRSEEVNEARKFN
ncbi:MAG: c-type cytochrome [Bacteroidales bacterium]